jgi:hypothetical protein
MSRSTATPPPERRAVSGAICGARKADEDEPPCARGTCQPVFAGRADRAQEHVAPYAADGRTQTNPQRNPQEVHCDADAVRSVPRV